MWEGVGDRTELQHIDPHSYGHNSVSFPFCPSGGLGPTVLGAGFLYRILSPTRLIPNWLTSCLHPGYIIIWHPLFLRASQFRNHSTRPRSRLWYPDIPRPSAPVIYTGAFPILTAWPGRRSICNNICVCEFVCVLVSLFNGASTIMDYSMQKPFL